MTRFLYFSDTHFGKEPNGFQQQQSYPEKLTDILHALKQRISEIGDVDFILHGGDMIHNSSDEDILSMVEALDWELPVYLCLGNHDLTTADAMSRWMVCAPQFFRGGSPVYTIETRDCSIHVCPNHWGGGVYHWQESQQARFSEDQLKFLSKALSKRIDIPHIISTHSPVFGLPTSQTKLAEEIHAPDALFTQQVVTLAHQHPHLSCVLGAHNHLNMRVTHSGVEYVTVSSIIETPFEYKVIEVDAQKISMHTGCLQGVLPFRDVYDVGRAYVQGRSEDRAFVSINTK